MTIKKLIHKTAHKKEIKSLVNDQITTNNKYRNYSEISRRPLTL